MGGKSPLASVLQVMDQISKYLAFLSVAISALTFGLEIRWLSYAFVVVACTAFSVWLWRKAWEKKPSGMLDVHGQPTHVSMCSTGGRVLILGVMACIDCVGLGWLAYNLPGEILSTPIESSSSCPEGMVLIPAGEFWMGALSHDGNAREDEQPGRLVYLDAFCIHVTEVSNRQYAEFVAATGHSPPPVAQPLQADSWAGTTYPSEYADYPVVRVSYEDASAYCGWLGCHLPSEAQWEKAARGVDEYIYPWGNDWEPSLANWAQANWKGACPVDEYPDEKSPYGLLNMAGNVAEWVDAWYLDDWYSQMLERNPVGPPDGTSNKRVVRGGSFWDSEQGLRVSARNGQFEPSPPMLASMNFVGFRCACQDGIE